MAGLHDAAGFRGLCDPAQPGSTLVEVSSAMKLRCLRCRCWTCLTSRAGAGLLRDSTARDWFRTCYLQAAGIALRGSAASMAVRPVNPVELMPGDLLFFNTLVTRSRMSAFMWATGASFTPATRAPASEPTGWTANTMRPGLKRENDN